MKEVFEAFLQTGIYGSILILLVIVLRLFLRKAPRLMFCILWLLVAIRLLIPVSIESRFSLQPSIPVQQTGIVTGKAPELPERQPEAVFSGETDAVSVQGNNTATDLWTRLEAVPGILWASGVTVFVLYCLISFLVLKAKVADAVKREEDIRVSRTIRGPFLLGYFKPVIYLPAGLRAEDREFVIAHERAHILRGDNWWKLVGFLCLCVHWYNPLVWLAYGLFCRDIEAACDEQVVADMDLQTRKAYAFALLNCGKQMSGLLNSPVAFGEVNLKHRIRKILSYRKPGLWITGGAVLLAVIVAVCFLTTPGNWKHAEDPSLSSPDELSVPEENAQSPSGDSVPAGGAETPTEETTAPAEGTTAPTEETAAPAEGTTAPTEETTESTEGTTAPTEENVPTEGAQVIAGGEYDGGPITWQVTADGTLTISGNRTVQPRSSYPWHGYADVVTRVVITYGVKNIPSNAFYGMYRVTEVSIPETVFSIEDRAFSYTAIGSFTVPAHVRELGSAFMYCGNLTSLTFAPGCDIDTLPAYALAYSGITAFVSPPGMHYIEEGAFANCGSLASVTLLNGVERVWMYAFENCRNLRSIILGGSIREIHQSAFDGCTGLQRMELYSGAWHGSFSTLYSLNTIVVGYAPERLNARMFDAPGLTQIIFTKDPPEEIDSNAFSGKNLTVYYPGENSEWSEEKRQDYGGTVTWIAQ